VVDPSQIVGFIDKNADSQGDEILGKPVVSPSNSSEFEFDSIVITSGSCHREILDSIKADPSLADKQLLWATELFVKEMRILSS
jgi:hypothetical protein